MDAVYLLILAGVYATTHWVAWAIAKLGSAE